MASSNADHETKYALLGVCIKYNIVNPSKWIVTYVIYTMLIVISAIRGITGFKH